jgi:hypothetical protein
MASSVARCLSGLRVAQLSRKRLDRATRAEDGMMHAALIAAIHVVTSAQDAIKYPPL